MKLILITLVGCPNAEKARALLKETGLNFTEINQDDLPSSDPLHGYTSPTLLADELVVFGSRTDSGTCGCTLDIPNLEELNRKLANGRFQLS